MAKKNPNSELLFSVTAKDLELQTFRSGGPGGQHQNKTSSGVRWIHHPSGARGESREERSQQANKKRALQRLVKDPKFIWWVHQETLKIDGKKTAEEKVAEALQSDNLLVEVFEDGEWIVKE